MKLSSEMKAIGILAATLLGAQGSEIYLQSGDKPAKIEMPDISCPAIPPAPPCPEPKCPKPYVELKQVEARLKEIEKTLNQWSNTYGEE